MKDDMKSLTSDVGTMDLLGPTIYFGTKRSLHFDHNLDLISYDK